MLLFNLYYRFGPLAGAVVSQNCCFDRKDSTRNFHPPHLIVLNPLLPAPRGQEGAGQGNRSQGRIGLGFGLVWGCGQFSGPAGPLTPSVSQFHVPSPKSSDFFKAS